MRDQIGLNNREYSVYLYSIFGHTEMTRSDTQGVYEVRKEDTETLIEKKAPGFLPYFRNTTLPLLDET